MDSFILKDNPKHYWVCDDSPVEKACSDVDSCEAECPPGPGGMNDNGPCRESAISLLRRKADRMKRNADNIYALLSFLECAEPARKDYKAAEECLYGLIHGESCPF